MKYRLRPRMAVLVFFVLMLMALGGCGASPAPEAKPPAPDVTVQPSEPMPVQPPQTAPVPDQPPQEDPAPTQPPQDSTVYVSSTQELLERIAPDTSIVIESGFYNMSEYLEAVWTSEGENWNNAHPYVQIRECFDGVEVVIRNVDGLRISGNSDVAADTELVTDPRYSTVMTFIGCNDLSISGLTMGHTQRGDCRGNVLNFYACRNVALDNVDLYGCGVYGIGAYEGTGAVSVCNSIIRECSYGPLDLYGCAGRLEFRDCMLIDSDGYGYYEDNDASELAFYHCEFGDNETSGFMFREDIDTEDCIWSENYIYPDADPGIYGGWEGSYPDADPGIYDEWYDVEPDSPPDFGENPKFYGDWTEFDPDNMEITLIDPMPLKDSYWTGHCMVNPESGETLYLPFDDVDGTHVAVNLELYENGEGWFDTGREFGYVTWGCESEYAWLQTADGRYYYMTPFVEKGPTDGPLWLLLELEECLVWMN